MNDAPHRLSLWLNDPASGPLVPGDVPVAMGALLVRVARADREYLPIEAAAIDEIFMLNHGLSRERAQSFRRLCESVEAAAPETARFAGLLRDRVAYGDRLSIAVSLWEVMMADGISRPEEHAVIALAEEILGVLRADLPAAR